MLNQATQIKLHIVMSMRIHQNSPFCILLCLFFAPILTLSAAENGTAANNPIFLACGASSTEAYFDDDKGVNWTGDANSAYAPSLHSLGPSFILQDPSVPKYPFSAVRLFTSPYTYQFSLNPGRKFIRLYFYPFNYTSNHDVADALITVTAGTITLLNNFSAYQTAQVLTYSYIVREYSVNVTTGVLNLTFSPSTTHPKAYAFINGIEIVSIIPDLFDIQSTSKIPRLINGGTPIDFNIEPEWGLETVFRLNVGGQSISAKNDSGKLFRSWEDDSIYIYGTASGVAYSKDDDVTIKYTSIVPEYIAPVDVYATARSMGPTPEINLNYNLSWVLNVDAGFYYLVRLHFCEIEDEITHENERVFFIYLNNLTAEPEADVIAWSGGLGIPIYQDYVVITSGSGQMDLWVELHPNIFSKPEGYDAILNGLEVFKLDSGGSLAGPNPVFKTILSTPPSSTAEQSKHKLSAAIAGGTAGGAAILLLGLCLVVMCVCRKKKGKNVPIDDGPSGWLRLSENKNSQSNPSPKTSTTTASQGSSLPANICRHFSLAEIKAATNDFHESLLLGVGGFGNVYRGEVDGMTKVAIKRANLTSSQGVHEFQTEIELLSKLRHKHLVSMIGYCEDNDEMILVYDYMANGTLREHLYGSDKPALTWKQRLELCIGAARGLHYLHTGIKQTIIHRDVKSTNILIDEHFVAKVSDFGLSKADASLGSTNTHVSTVVKGSFGYLDPEYMKRQVLTEKSDVYSFGVVLFEVLCARPAVNHAFPKEQVSLAEWALRCQRKGVIDQIVDPNLKGKIASQCLKKFAETAEKCLSEYGLDRPTMSDVLWNLEFALRLQESDEEMGSLIATTEGSPLSVIAATSTTDSPFMESTTSTTSTTSTSQGGRSVASNDSVSLNPSAVFSQILNPAGR